MPLSTVIAIPRTHSVYKSSPPKPSRLRYSTDMLLTIGITNAHTRIRRCVRRVLFKLKLWKPRRAVYAHPPSLVWPNLNARMSHLPHSKLSYIDQQTSINYANTHNLPRVCIQALQTCLNVFSIASHTIIWLMKCS